MFPSGITSAALFTHVQILLLHISFEHVSLSITVSIFKVFTLQKKHQKKTNEYLPRTATGPANMADMTRHPGWRAMHFVSASPFASNAVDAAEMLIEVGVPKNGGLEKYPFLLYKQR